MTFRNRTKVQSADKLNSGLQISPVQNRQDLKQFIRLPWSIYSDDPAWVPPLLLERRLHLSPKNPYFEHAEFCSWIAYRNLKPVGRVSAQVDRLHIDRYRDDTGFFGMLEAEDNIETIRTLLQTAENWLQDKGMKKICGPFNLSINQELGLLVDGFETPPSLMMGHAKPYYGRMIEESGYRREKDLLAYVIASNFEMTRTANRLLSRTRDQIVVRNLKKSNFIEELRIIRDIFNDAWSNNWNFVPFTKAEFEHLGKDLRLLAVEDLLKIAEIDGHPAAFLVALPNLNEVIRDFNGRLLPIGWLKLLWRLKIKFPRSVRIPLMGVRRQYHDSRMGAALAFSIIGAVQQPGIKRGVKEVELSWILEDNLGMRNIIESIGGQVYKTYRMYSRELT